MKPLILLHGALGSAQQFESWKAGLQTQYALHIPDLEGHGSRAPGDRAFRMEHFVEDLREWVKANGLQGAAIFGYSMGGYAALCLEAAQPGTFGKIFTFATKFDWSPEGAAKEAKMLNPAVMLEKVPAFAAALEARHGARWQEVVTKTAEMMQALGANPILTAEVLNAIHTPVRAGVGSLDNMVTQAETLWAADALGNGAGFVMEGVMHPIEKMESERMVGEILGWVG